MQTFIYCKVNLHVSGVTAPIIRSTKTVTATSGTGHNNGTAASFQSGLLRTYITYKIKQKHTKHTKHAKHAKHTTIYTMIKAANCTWSICLLILSDSLLLRPFLHFTTLHPTTLNSTSLSKIQITTSFYKIERSYLYSDTIYTWVTWIILIRDDTN